MTPSISSSALASSSSTTVKRGSKGSSRGREPPGDLPMGDREDGEGMGWRVGVWAWLEGLLGLGLAGGGVGVGVGVALR